MLDSDARALAEALASTLGPLLPPTGRRGTAPPPIRVLQCVLEPSRFYDDGVARRFRARFPDVRTCEDLHALMARRGGARGFLLEVLGLRDARRGRVLEETLGYVIEVQRQYRGTTEAQRMRKWAVSVRPGDAVSVGIDGFGLHEFQRLRALFGANAAMPDGRVTRYIARLLHKPVSKVQSLYLLERAGQLAGFDVRDIEARLDAVQAI